VNRQEDFRIILAKNAPGIEIALRPGRIEICSIRAAK
jgi:hypothetical protein